MLLDMASLLLLNGPNLNLLGTRQPEIYGAETLAEVEDTVRRHAESRGHSMVATQSNHEGGLVEALHGARSVHRGVILNAGAYTHTSVAVRDAISAIDLPVVEVHMSNIHGRESFRHRSLIAPVCIGQISGFGIRSYLLAVDALAAHLDANP